MKRSRKQVRRHFRALPELKFENQALTSFAGLVIFQKFFHVIKLVSRLRPCFRSQEKDSVYSRAKLFVQLIVHFLLGFRELQQCRYYQQDPLVQRLLGLEQIPGVSTLSRMLKRATPRTVEAVRCLLQDLVVERLQTMKLKRITLDFDGSVQSTRRHAEGTAVGFNKKRKGARSYYPLFCTVAQTRQVLNLLHRPGNVHDSNGALEFILQCIDTIRANLPGVVVEVRMDSAFFSDEIVNGLERRRVEFTISVPFERFIELKGLIEKRKRWTELSADTSYFEPQWRPKSWSQSFRFLCIRTRRKVQLKGTIQLDLFEPRDFEYEFKVIVTNKTLAADSAVAYHEGRGSQEGIFAELKTACHMDYVPVRTRCGNQLYLLAGLFAHNLTRELQMVCETPKRRTTVQRQSWWSFERLETIRHTLIHRAGRLTSPHGVLTLTISAAADLKKRVLRTLDRLSNAG